MSDGGKPAGLELAPWPQVDFAAFGEIEARPLSRIQKIVGSTMARNWVMIPHVTHHEEIDISSLDEVRRKLAADSGVRITPLAFLIKAAVVALKALPQFNTSIDGSGQNLVQKKYFHIGFAVDTPVGLLVPVIRDVDKKSIPEIATEVLELSLQARSKGLPMDRMVGGCFTISSLGSIGGTAFTPIINAPEVAVMGVTKAYEKPIKVDGQLAWRTVLPLSLSYDHRVINGADAARFCLEYGKALAQPDALVASN